MNFLSNNLVRQGAATTIAGTSAVNGAIFDMSRYEGIVFIAKFGTAATDNTIKAQQGADSGLSDAADLAGSSVAVGASDEIVCLEIHKPIERYVRMVAVRGTSTTLDWAVAIPYDHRGKSPVSNSVAGTIASEIHVSPAEGTA